MLVVCALQLFHLIIYYYAQVSGMGEGGEYSAVTNTL